MFLDSSLCPLDGGTTPGGAWSHQRCLCASERSGRLDGRTRSSVVIEVLAHSYRSSAIELPNVVLRRSSVELYQEFGFRVATFNSEMTNMLRI
jgi:hypothetical protein